MQIKTSEEIKVSLSKNPYSILMIFWFQGGMFPKNRMIANKSKTLVLNFTMILGEKISSY